MDAALRRNADFASKPCVLQHFGSPPFNSITSKYCKGYKFHKKEDFKMLKNRGVVPGPVTLFVVPVKGGLGTKKRLPGSARTISGILGDYILPIPPFTSEPERSIDIGKDLFLTFNRKSL